MIHYGKADYKECLKSLKHVLSNYPRCPPSVRYGIGLCYYNLGNYTKARLAFQRLLEIEPNHSLAHAGLAIIELQIKVRAQANDRIVKHIEASFKADPTNPIALKLIAEHFFKVRNFEMAQGVC